jgi:hypothetical protein
VAAINLILRKRAQRKVAESELEDVVARLYHRESEDVLVSFSDRVDNLPDNYPRRMLRLVRLDAQTVWALALWVFASVDILVMVMAGWKSPWLGEY